MIDRSYAYKSSIVYIITDHVSTALYCFFGGIFLENYKCFFDCIDFLISLTHIFSEFILHILMNTNCNSLLDKTK